MPKENIGVLWGTKFINPPIIYLQVPTMNWILLYGATVVINEDLSLLEVVISTPDGVRKNDFRTLGHRVFLHSPATLGCPHQMPKHSHVWGNCCEKGLMFKKQKSVASSEKFQNQVGAWGPTPAVSVSHTCIFLLLLWKYTEHCA